MTTTIDTVYYCTRCETDSSVPRYEVPEKEQLRDHVRRAHPRERFELAMGMRTPEEDREYDFATNPRSGTNHVLDEFDGLRARAPCGTRFPAVEGNLGYFPIENDGKRCERCPWSEVDE